ncbi:MAG TPA: sugar phosphate isomerase/epimerase [Acidimicrobiales bacterium]|nr:sugar phosphate isomerase/epimerase [Acidimicrobiales bacterium]
MAFTGLRFSSHLVAWPRLHQGLAEAARLGFPACEVFADAVVPRLAAGQDVVCSVHDFDLEVSAVYLDGDPAGVAQVEAAARAARDVESTRLVMTLRGGAGGDTSEVAMAVDGAAAASAALGVQLSVHPQAGSALTSRQEIAALLAATDPDLVSLCLDTGQVAGAGEDPLEVLRDAGPRLGVVHLADVRPGGAPCVFGDGIVDIGSLLDELADREFSGWVTVEMAGVADPTLAVAGCRDALVRLGFWPPGGRPWRAVRDVA